MSDIILNAAQIVASVAPQQEIYLEWGRGAGKSTILGKYMRDMVISMPRASFALVGATYMQILSRTLPSTKEGLAMYGIHEDYDYVVGRSGKKNGFAMPFQAPDRWNNVIHFSNGTIFQLVSLDNPNTGRGLNSYGVIGDEAALLDPEKLYINVQATNRAKKKIFEKARYLGTEVYASSTPLTQKGKWFTDREQQAIKNPSEVFFHKANAWTVNRDNLRASWFKQMRDKAFSETHYKAEILNIRPTEITDGFYAQLKPDTHYYKAYSPTYYESVPATTLSKSFDCRGDGDLFPDLPLILSIDFGVFNSMLVQQEGYGEYRVVKEFWVKSPKILNDLIQEEFAPYYRYHKTKHILLYYGHEGNNTQVNSTLTLADEVCSMLRKCGYTVSKMTRGAAPTHESKYYAINEILSERLNVPNVRINEDNCPDLIVSLEHAEAKEGYKTGLTKDKSSERNKSIKQQHATHLSDCFDMPIYSRYHQRVFSKSSGDYLPILT